MKPTKRVWGWPSAMALAGWVWLSVLAGARAATIELQIKAFIDGQDQLVIGGDSLQWHHLGNVVPGRWEQTVEQPTVISSALDGAPQMSEVAWIPEWPEPFPEPIEHPAWSSVFTGWRPGLPATDMTVTLIPRSVRWSASIVQSPAAGNGYQTIVWFDDGPPAGADWYEVAIRYQIPPPEIVTQPGDQSVVAGAAVGMEVTARGAVPLAYQWSKDGNALVEGGRISGANTPRLTITNVVVADAGLYQVIVTNQFGSVASQEAQLTVSSSTAGQKLREFQTGGAVHTSAAIGADGTVYVGSYDQKVYALDGATGAKRWEFTTDGEVFSSPAIGADGTVYVGSHDHKVYALEGMTGGKRWEFATGDRVHGSPAIGADGTVYVGSYDHRVYALNGATGERRWEYETGGYVSSSAAIGADGTVYVECLDGKIYALDGATGQKAWEFQTDFMVGSSPAIGADGTVYVGSAWRVYALNGATGLKRWEYSGGGLSHSSPAIGADGTVYVGCTNELRQLSLTALNGATGEKRWEFVASGPVESCPAIGADGTVYVGSWDMKVYALDGATGQKRWEYATAGGVVSSPAIGADGTVYVGSGDGKVYALSSSSVGGLAPGPWPKFRANARSDGRVAGAEPAQAPVVIAQPEDVTAAVGANISFAVVASGAPPLSYQWHRDGTPLAAGGRIAGVNTARLTITNLVVSDVGSYSVVITNSVESVTSRPAALTLSSGGQFYLSFDNTLAGAASEQPTKTTGVSFVPGVTGAAAWIPRGSTLTYDSAGRITTNEGTLDFWVKPAWAGGDDATHFFLSWGTDGGAVFSKDGANNLRFYFNQWRIEVGAFVGVSDWQPEVWHHVAYTWKSAPTLSPRSQLKIYLDGKLRASNTSSALAAAPLQDGPRLRVGGDLNDAGHSLQGALDELRVSEVEHSAAEIAQTHATGLAWLAPSLASQPAPRTNELGATAAFTVAASGYEPLSYLWRKDNLTLVDDGRVSGSTTPTLTISDCRASDTGAYAVTVRNRYGQATSAQALLTVLASPIRFVTNLVWVETLAGSGVAGYADGPGTQAQFNHPNDGAVDRAGIVYIADTYGNRIRKISPTGEVTTLAGTGIAGHADGPGTVAQFNEPLGLCVDAAGHVYVVEAANHCLRRITPDGQVSTLAGNLTAGHRDGLGAQAQFNMPNDVTLDAAGNLYVTEFDNHTVRRVAPDGTVSTWVGSRTAGYQDGPREQARLTQPGGIACDAAGTLYLTEWGGQRIRKVGVDGMVSTVAGTGETGYRDGPASQAQFNQPDGIAVDGLGNLWITDYGNHVIRRISAAGLVETVAGTGAAGCVDGEGQRAQFAGPAGIGYAGAETFYVADWWNHVVRRVILPRPVEIVEQPASWQVWLAEDVTFRVSAQGTPLLGYTWYKDGVALTEGMRLEGVHTPELRLRLAQPEEAGSYWVVVTNRAGARSSASASLAVVEPEPGRADWEFTADGMMWGCPAIGWDGTLHVTYYLPGGSGGGVHALDGTTGGRKWTFNANSEMGGAPAVGPDGTVYAESGPGFLHALDGATGTIKWQVARTGGLGSPAIAEDGTVVARIGTSLRAFEGGTGTERWQFPLAAGSESLPVIAPPGTVYVGSWVEGVCALDLTTGLVQWRLPLLPKGVFSPPALGPDGALYVVSFTNDVYALEGNHGTVKWHSEQGYYGLTSPVVGADGTVYVGSRGDLPPSDYLQALDGLTGALKWEFTDQSGSGPFPPALAENGTLYVGSGSRLHALDAATGARKRLFTVEQAISSPPTLSEAGWLYVAGGDRLYAFWVGSGLAYAPWPKDRGDAQNSGRYSCRAEKAAIVYQPRRRVLGEGETGRIEVRMRPDAGLALQWFHDGAPVAGGTNALLTFSDVSREDEGSYGLLASNALCQVRSETIVAIASNVKPQYYPGWRWEGGGSPRTVEASPTIVGPWTALFQTPAGANSGHYVETNPSSPALYYRLREEGGEATSRFTATALIPGWWYGAAAGSRHQIEYVWSGRGWTNWVELTVLTVPESPHLFLDTGAFDHPGAVYRTTPVP